MWSSFTSGSHRNTQGQGLLRNSRFGASQPTRIGESGSTGQHLVRSHHDLSRGNHHAGYGYDSGQHGAEPTTLISAAGDDPGELELVVIEAMRVLRLKNAIKGLVDVVSLYGAVESAMGPYAESYLEATRASAIEISMARREFDPERMVDEGGVTSGLLKISSALNKYQSGWYEAYPPGRDSARSRWNRREDEEFDSGRYVAGLKRLLHPSKLGGLVKAAAWLQNVERDLRNMRSQHTPLGMPAAARGQGHRRLY